MKKQITAAKWKDLSLLTNQRGVNPRQITGYITGDLNPDDEIINHDGTFKIIEVTDRRKANGNFTGTIPDHFTATCIYTPHEK